MPNVDDHGLEVLKKAARNLDVIPKRDYALQVIIVKDESGGTIPFIPVISNVSIPLQNVEIEIDLPEDCKYFILKARKSSRLRLSYVAGGTNIEWMTIPRGGYWIEEKRLQGKNVYIQSNIDDNLIEVIAYI
jgi:hypothetical protein